MRIVTNIGEVSQRIADRLKVIAEKDYLLRPVAFGLIDKMTFRIHNEGKGSDEAPIGRYNNNYLRLRQRKYSRDGDPKIIVSLTRQLENDWAVIAVGNGYGVGFNNPFNLQKARWVEENKGKKIFSLSPSEQQYVNEYLNELVTDAINT